MLVAFITGLLGSFHCVGMCGGIVLAVQAKHWQNALIYHLGRSLMYAMIGLLFGLFGRGLYVAGFQQYLSIFLGICMIGFVLLPTQNFPFLYQFYQKAKQLFKPLQIQNSFLSTFTLGILNGLLPCGLVYAAVFVAIATADAFYGASYMFLFGLGTMPMLFALSISGKIMPVSIRFKLNKLIPVFVVCVGILLIIRGLNLNIPYLSPYIEPYQEITSCHG
ncbi:MAG: sulfite exporter TauE/SafE family protein [Cytophagales bacterium]|nr:MAG: sulfite exporter TauE/SafE family protein [Cytophagales bacterium]